MGPLVRERAEYVPDRGPDPASSDQVNDERRPLFGAELELGVRAVGTIDVLVELLKSRSEPNAWNAEGTSISAGGWSFLVLHGPRALLDESEKTLADMERDALNLVTVDVLALEGDAAAAAGERGVAGGLETGALRIVAAARACAYPGQRVAVLSGGERAYLADHDVEVAEEASTTDPIVGVLNEGLCVRVRPVLSGDDVRLDFGAWFARLEGLEARRTAEGETIETPAMRVHETATPMLKASGTWAYLAAGKDMGFAVRSSMRPPTTSALGASLPGLPHTALAGPLQTTILDVADLSQRNTSYRAPRRFLRPSNFKPPEEPELPEPAALFPEDLLVETTRMVVDPESWESEGVSLEVSNRRLIVRTDATHTAAVKDLLAALRKTFVRSYRVKATVVSLPLASFPELASGLDDGTTLLADGGAGLLARAGARIEDRATVRFLRGGRTGAEEGKLHRYVGDYNVEIAKKATIGNPVVITALEGLSLDVAGQPSADGSLLDLDVRIDRSTWQEARRVKTRHGDLECPRIGLSRIRGCLVVPVGATRLAGTSVEGDRATLFLLTATAE